MELLLDADLTTLPNLYLVINPVTTLRESGTVVGAEVSLGYDVPRQKIEQLLPRRESLERVIGLREARTED